MPMKRLLVISFFVVAALSCGCSQEEDTLSNQREKLVSYLERTHSPALVAESSLEEGSQLPYYSVAGNTVCRYIKNVYDPNRVGQPEVGEHSTVSITFRAYVFAFSNISDSTFPFWSNDPLLESAYEGLGLTVAGGVWTFEPLVLQMDGDILKGLRLALLGCREGDDVEVYMTYNMAYGDGLFSTIPLQSPVAWFFTVDAVE